MVACQRVCFGHLRFCFVIFIGLGPPTKIGRQKSWVEEKKKGGKKNIRKKTWEPGGSASKWQTILRIFLVDGLHRPLMRRGQVIGGAPPEELQNMIKRVGTKTAGGAAAYQPTIHPSGRTRWIGYIRTPRGGTERYPRANPSIRWDGERKKKMKAEPDRHLDRSTVTIRAAAKKYFAVHIPGQERKIEGPAGLAEMVAHRRRAQRRAQGRGIRKRGRHAGRNPRQRKAMKIEIWKCRRGFSANPIWSP